MRYTGKTEQNQLYRLRQMQFDISERIPDGPRSALHLDARAHQHRASLQFAACLESRSKGTYQRDWLMEPTCSVCGLQLPIISTVLPKSLQDSWAWFQ